MTINQTPKENKMKKLELTRPLAIAVGTALIGTASAAAASPFSMTTLASPYMMTADDTSGGGQPAEGTAPAEKAKEGKCGEDKAKEGKCGEGKCGEGKCGDDKKEAEGQAPAETEAGG
jgi:uncharacterized low-complexity protein